VRLVRPLVLLCAGAACSPAPRTEPPASVLLVTIDTLRADRLGCYGDAKARTPVLDALAAAGTRFERVFATAPITLPSHTSIMTGLYPPAHGVRGNGSFALGPGPLTLAEAFKARGFATAAIVGALPLEHRFGLGRGFESYDDRFGRHPGVHFEFAERKASEVTAAAKTWIEAHGGTSFVWVHYFDPHHPYDPPAAFRTDDPYRDEIASVDAALGELLAAWNARHTTSIVVVTADHGEAFGEHREESHSLFVYDTTLRVPLILKGPRLEAGRVIERSSGLVDLGATILEMLGGPPSGFPGRSLLAAGASEPALYSETLAPRLDFGWSDLRAWREGRFKFIRAPKPELYDVVADPLEATNLIDADRPTAERLRRELEAFLGRTKDAEAFVRADAEQTEAFRGLGYVQGPGGRGSGADPKDQIDIALAISRAAGPFPDAATALESYRQLVRLDPDNPLINLRLADALLRAGREKESLAYFRRVIRAGPRTTDAFVGLATALANLGQLEESRAALMGALGVDPRSGQAHFNLGELARLAGRSDEARHHYEAALDDEATRTAARARLAP